METLAAISDELVTYLEFHIDGALSSASVEQQASDADAVCLYYQAVGICELLLDGEVDAFFHHLIRSAQSRLWLLERSRRTPGYPRRAIKASNTRGLNAAIAARQWPLARAIAESTTSDWWSDVEYEDDFCAAHFVHRHLLSAQEAELRDILARFEVALEGQSSATFDLCRGLLSRDQGDCEAAFGALLEQRKERIADMKRSSVYATDGLFRPQSSIYLEGLAWLSLLEAAGVRMAAEFPYCPSLARKASYAPFVVTTFPGVPL